MTKELLLVGGGHSHVEVLRRFGLNPLPGVRLTLLSNQAHTPYSGMLPGYIAGHYTFEEAHIDLRPLCHFAGAHFYHEAAIGLDLAARQILCADRPPVPFDVVSMDIGSSPRTDDVPGAREFAIPFRPIPRFLAAFEMLVEQVKQQPNDKHKLVVVGGGAGGVELTLAIRHRLLSVLATAGFATSQLQFEIVSATDTILANHNRRVQSKFARVLRERGIQVVTGCRVTAVQPNLLLDDQKQSNSFHTAFWVTDAAAPPWIRSSGLATDPAGFVAVSDYLQSTSHPFVFAAGDIAAVVAHPRPKAGVFAVRQGPPLAENLKRALTGQPLRPFVAQRQFLSLISTGDQHAVASRGGWAAGPSRQIWKLKDWIDRRWMARYQQFAG